MISESLNDAELLRRKRELRLRIGRSRRRIDDRLRATQHRAGQLLSWRTYVVRYPAWALAAALGAGLAASSGLRRGRISRWLGLALVRHAMGGFQQHAWTELRRFWSNAGRNHNSQGGTRDPERPS
jgi:hypothetical protein